ncbi:MAG: esterase-like activity of phytase family protein [Geminicoccaceae bacterium]
MAVRKRPAFFLMLLLAAMLHPAYAHASFWTPSDVRLHAVEMIDGESGNRRIDGIDSYRSFRLSSSDPRFGGLSGALWMDGRLYLVSDRATLFRATPRFDGQGLIDDLTDWQAADLEDFDIRRSRLDVESLAGAGHDRLMIALEDQSGLRVLDLGERTAGMKPSGYSAGFRELGGNEGIEAIATLPGGSMLAFSEGERLGRGHAASVIDSNGHQSLSYRTASGFAVTGADRLGAEIFVLERRFGLLSGWQARVSRFDVSALDRALKGEGPDREIDPHALVHLHPPIRTDNFEGIAVRKTGDNHVAVTLVSDDNFSPFQDTLLLDFAIADNPNPR